MTAPIQDNIDANGGYVGDEVVRVPRLTLTFKDGDKLDLPLDDVNYFIVPCAACGEVTKIRLVRE